MKLRMPLAAAIAAIALVPPAADAESWQYVRTLGTASTGITALNDDGHAIVDRQHRWTPDTGLVDLSGAPSGCGVTLNAIARDGSVLGTRVCSSGAVITERTGLVWAPRGTVPSTSGFPAHSEVKAAAGQAFVANLTKNTPSSADDTTLRGVVTDGVVGTSVLTDGIGFGINPASNILSITPRPLDAPASLALVDGLEHGPNSAGYTADRCTYVVGLLPNGDVLVREKRAGSAAPGCQDTALRAYDGYVAVDMPQQLGDSAVQVNPQALAGATPTKAVLSTVAGGSLPAGTQQVVVWSQPLGSAPRGLPIFFSEGSTVRPTAMSPDGRWLGFSNGQVWFDPDGEPTAPPTPPAPVADALQQAQQGRPALTTRPINPSPALKQLATIERNYWRGQAGKAALDAERLLSWGSSSSAGSSPHDLAVALVWALRDREEFWETVRLDPPDPDPAIASAPKVTVSRLALKGLKRTQAQAVRRYAEAQLRVTAAQTCATDAINRAASQLAAGNQELAGRQYRAGAVCLRAGADQAARIRATAAKAVTALRARHRATARKAPRRPAKSRYTARVRTAVSAFGKVIAIPADDLTRLRGQLTAKRTPAKPARVDLSRTVSALAARTATTADEMRTLAVEFDAAAGT